MNKIFRVRIRWYQYLFLLLLGGLSFFLLWDKKIIPGAACMLFLVFLIERFIHTTYTLTADGALVIYLGRFFRTKVIRIRDIASIELRCSVKVGGRSLLRYVIIGLNTGGYLSLMPLDDEEFIRRLSEQKESM